MSGPPIHQFNDNDVADVARLNEIIDSVNELKNDRIVMRYVTPELTATRPLRIAVGRVDVPAGVATETLEVPFEGFFEATFCRPVVNVTLSSNNRRRCFISVSRVTDAGFEVTVETASGEPFIGTNSIFWTAYGF
jgi:hypothetical protein